MALAGNLSVAMSLNSAAYRKGLDDARNRTTTFRQKISSTLGRITSGFNGLRAGIAGVTAALGVAQILQTADELVKLSDATGIGFDSLQRLQFGFEQAGLSQSDFQKGIRTFSRAFSEAGMGVETYVSALANVGLSYEELEGLSPEDRFLAVVDAVNQIADPSERAAAAQELLGRNFADVAVSSDAVIQAGEGIVPITEEMARSAEASNDSFNRLSTNLRNLTANALGPTLEFLTPVVEAFSNFAQQEPMLAALGVAIGGIGAAIALVGGPITAITLAIGALVVAWENWDEIVAFFQRKWDEFAESFPGTAEALMKVADGLSSAWNLLADAFKSVANFITEFSLDEALAGIQASISNTFNSLLSEIANWLEELPLIGGKAASLFRDQFLAPVEETYEEAVGGSIIPDMVDEIEAVMNRLPIIAGETGSEYKRRLLQEFKETSDGVFDITKEMNSAGERAFNGLADALTTFATTGKNTFGDFARSVIQDLINIQIRSQLAGLFGGTNLFSSFAGFFASGGNIPAGQFGLVGEAGPELIRGPAQVISARDTQDIIGAPSGQSSVVNINISGNVDQRAIDQIRSVVASSPREVGPANSGFSQNVRGLNSRRRV